MSNIKKQFTFGVTETLKSEIGELRTEFTRPAAVAKAPPVVMSEKEALEVLHKVATDRRFKVVNVLDESGAQVFDEDGLPQMETLDLFGEAWEEIKLRDYQSQVSKTPTIDGLIAQIKKYGASLNLSEETIATMIASATAKPETAPAEA